jgi:hypothetical protein
MKDLLTSRSLGWTAVMTTWQVVVLPPTKLNFQNGIAPLHRAFRVRN